MKFRYNKPGNEFITAEERRHRSNNEGHDTLLGISIFGAQAAFTFESWIGISLFCLIIYGLPS